MSLFRSLLLFPSLFPNEINNQITNDAITKATQMISKHTSFISFAPQANSSI